MAISPLVAFLLTIGMSLVPTVLFLGLWRGLMYLRDDELVAEVRRMQAQQARFDAPSGGGPSRDVEPADAISVCPACGSRNAAGMTYCWNCLGRLDE